MLQRTEAFAGIPVHGLAAIIIASTIFIAACNSEIYVRDGVTDGDTFYLAQRALIKDNPVLQSWVAYSLTRSACQLEIGGDNPARASSFDCELTARRHLLQTWEERQLLDPRIEDAYLDGLQKINAAGFMDEHVVHHFNRRHWQVPQRLDSPAYRRWRQRNIPSVRAETRIVGSWNYASKVRGGQSQQ